MTRVLKNLFWVGKYVLLSVFKKTEGFISVTFTSAMKKLFAFLLIILYTTASSGVVLNVHYCMGKLASVEVDNFSSKLCKCGMKQTESGCCHSELKVIKLSNAHKGSIANIHFQNSFEAAPAKAFTALHVFQEPINGHEKPLANGPPIMASNKLYKELCVFRI